MKKNIIALIVITSIGIFLIIKGIIGLLKKETNLSITPKEYIKVRGKMCLVYSVIDIILGSVFLVGEIVIIILAIFEKIKLK